MRESGSASNYTLPGLISGLDEVISQFTRATRQAIRGRQPAQPPGSGQLLTTGGTNQRIPHQVAKARLLLLRRRDRPGV